MFDFARAQKQASLDHLCSEWFLEDRVGFYRNLTTTLHIFRTELEGSFELIKSIISMAGMTEIYALKTGLLNGDFRIFGDCLINTSTDQVSLLQWMHLELTRFGKFIAWELITSEIIASPKDQLNAITLLTNELQGNTCSEEDFMGFATLVASLRMTADIFQVLLCRKSQQNSNFFALVLSQFCQRANEKFGDYILCVFHQFTKHEPERSELHIDIQKTLESLTEVVTIIHERRGRINKTAKLKLYDWLLKRIVFEGPAKTALMDLLNIN